MGVRLPPIEAGGGLTVDWRVIGPPWPLNSMPAKGERRRMGVFAGPTLALQAPRFGATPGGGKRRSTSPAVTGVVTVGLMTGTGATLASLTPTKKTRSRP